MGPITDSHKLNFQKNLELALRQLNPILEPAFTYHTGFSGEAMQMLELIGQTAAVKNIGRFADTPNIQNTVEPIWLSPTQLAWGQLMELEDTIKSVVDHQSIFIQAGATGMMIGAEELLRDALFGPRTIGKRGSTTAAWNGPTVPVGIGSSDDVTAIGMKVAKIIRGRRLFQENHVQTRMETIYLATDAQAMEELFRDLTYISADYRNRKVLDEPERVDILGVTILPPLEGTTAIPDFDATTSVSALFCKSGMHFADFSALRTDIPLRADKMNRPHPQMERWLGASRSEDAKVIKILNKK